MRPSRKSFSTISSMFCRARLQNTFWLSSLWPVSLGPPGQAGTSPGPGRLRPGPGRPPPPLPALQVNAWLSRLKKGSSWSMLRMAYSVSSRWPGDQGSVRVDKSSSGFFCRGNGKPESSDASGMKAQRYLGFDPDRNICCCGVMTDIWNCGRLSEGRARARSSSLQADSSVIMVGHSEMVKASLFSSMALCSSSASRLVNRLSELLWATATRAAGGAESEATTEESIWKKVWSMKRSKASFFQARRVYW
ncbi:hypothetical protein CRUP_018115 [Coryphaenoides rupestris]|nr:hypothetical protein CRUP_018115 [Coryphaenoides rupestris]